MSRNRKAVSISDAIQLAFTQPIKAALTYSTDGATWKVDSKVAEAARQGFVGLITGAGKFASIEIEVSNEFGAPECYTDSDSNGYKPMRDFLKLTYPGFKTAQEFVEQQNKLDVDKRDGAGMSIAEAHINRSARLIQQAIGFLYAAWKARTNPSKEPSEPQTAREFIREIVIPRLAKMAGDKSKLNSHDKRDAQFWLNWISYGQEHRKSASDFLVQHTLNSLAQSQDKSAQKAGPVRQLAAHEVELVNKAVTAAVNAVGDKPEVIAE